MPRHAECLVLRAAVLTALGRRHARLEGSRHLAPLRRAGGGHRTHLDPWTECFGVVFGVVFFFKERGGFLKITVYSSFSRTP